MNRHSFTYQVVAGFFGLVLSFGADAAPTDLVAVVPIGNPLTTLSKSQVVDIFLGRASRFPDGSRAVPIDQVEGSHARDDFYLEFAGKSPAQLKAHWSKIIFTGRGQPPRNVANSTAVKKYLVNNPSAIGYIEESMVDASVKVLIEQ